MILHKENTSIVGDVNETVLGQIQDGPYPSVVESLKYSGYW